MSTKKKELSPLERFHQDAMDRDFTDEELMFINNMVCPSKIGYTDFRMYLEARERLDKKEQNESIRK